MVWEQVVVVVVGACAGGRERGESRLNAFYYLVSVRPRLVPIRLGRWW